MTKPASPLLSRAAIIIGFGALIGAAFVGFSALVVLLGLAIAAALVSKLWSHLCLKRVTGEHRLSEKRVFPGDEVHLTMRVSNRKLLPLPWVEISVEIPATLIGTTNEGGEKPRNSTDRQLPAKATKPVKPPQATESIEVTQSAETADRSGFVTLSRSTPLLWYSAATFSQQLDASARGYYPLGPLSVISGDIFGLYPRDIVQPGNEHLIVYPRTYPLSELGVPSLSLLGDSRSELRVFDDPSRLIGVREYEPGDSLRRIHWKASARSGALQVKLFEFTADLKATIFLGADTFVGRPKDEFELGISTAASVARHLVERDMQVGLYVNTKQADSRQPACIAAGAGSGHLALILEALAKTTTEVDSDLLDFFERRRGDLRFGDTLIFVIGELSPAIELLMADLIRAGTRLVGLKIGTNGRESQTYGMHWHHVDQRAVA